MFSDFVEKVIETPISYEVKQRMDKLYEFYKNDPEKMAFCLTLMDIFSSNDSIEQMTNGTPHETVTEFVEDLPPVTSQEPKIGRWIYGEDNLGTEIESQESKEQTISDIELVVKVSEEKYNIIKSDLYNTFPIEMKEWGLEAIKNGILLTNKEVENDTNK